jgi:hypothetical protein
MDGEQQQTFIGLGFNLHGIRIVDWSYSGRANWD